MKTQLGLFDSPAPTPARPHGKTKCRRANCGHTFASHSEKRCFGDGDCRCSGFLSVDDIAKPPRKVASDSERMYREAYEAGIREGAPDHPFTVAGQRVGSILGPALREHAKGIEGPDLLAWIREKACAFRKATAADSVYWGGWQPYQFVKWLNMGDAKKTTGPRATNKLQPMPEGGLVVRSKNLSEIK